MEHKRKHRGQRHERHPLANTTSRGNNHGSRKRPAVDAHSPPAKKTATTSNRSPHHQSSSKHQHLSSSRHSSNILKGLFQAGNSGGPDIAIDLTMSDSESEAESDLFHDLLFDGAFEDTPTSSQGIDGSSPASTSNSGPNIIKSRKVQSHSAATRTSTTSNAAEGSPAWALFSFECEDEGDPGRVLLPKHDSATRSEQPTSIQTKHSKPAYELQGDGSETVASTSSSDSDDCIPALTPRTGVVAPLNVVETHMRVGVMQAQMDGRKAVPWGVQYYLACLVSFGLFSLDELSLTKGVNALRSPLNATSIIALFEPTNQQILWEACKEKGQAPVMARRATDWERQVHAELDREAQILAESRFNGVIGPPGEEMRSFGGRVLFEGRIACIKNEEPPKIGKHRKHRDFEVQLLPPKMGGSCRFSRRFGSVSILRLKMEPSMAKDARRFAVHPKTRDIQQEISDFFARPLLIMGRKYRPFICKDETIFYLWIESPKNCPEQPEFDCIWDFIDHHQPFAENGRSPLGKYIQRVQLGLSTSVPASVIDKITYEPDVFGDPDPVTGKRVEMTDGAGVVSLAVAKDIAEHLGYESVPCAFQGRVAGSKGVWYIEPRPERSLPGEKPTRWIRVRDSQKKINYADDKPLDPSQLVIDLLGPSRTFAPSTLSKQIIMVMQANGVPTSTFEGMQEAELRAIIDEISNWDGPDATVCMRLATVVEKYCKTESMKAKRSTESAEHRAQGMSDLKGKGNDGSSSFGDDDRDIFHGQNGRHLWNGMPLCKNERAYEMLLVGFHPKSCPYLAELLVEIADNAMKRIIKRFTIPVPRSAEAMVMPDPTGTLEEGEIQFRFSGDRLLDPETRLKLNHVPEGDVLVTRHPCLLPTDIRKVRAVVRPELSTYEDVVVFSIKGQGPLASLLGGGDHDGDTIRVFWEPKLVEPFQNSDTKYADCPFEISDVFDKSNTTVADFVAAHSNKKKNERDTILVKELVAGAFQPAVRGLYGVMHLYAAWQLGTYSKEAVELAHKFCQCMDGQKTGLTLKARVRINDSKKYLGAFPDWAYDSTDESEAYDWFSKEDYSPASTAIRNAARPESALCALWIKGKVQTGMLKKKLFEQMEKFRGVEDKAISGLWKQAQSLGRVSTEEEEVIGRHVRVMEDSYSRTNRNTTAMIKKRKGELSNSATSKTGFKNDGRQTKAQPLRRVQSEANPSMSQREELGGSQMEGEAATFAVDDLSSNGQPERRGGTIEVPTVLGSASEVGRCFCQWPEAFAKKHMSKLDDDEIERLARLRASYAYSITYSHRPKFAFEMAWRWIMSLKAKETGNAGTTSDGRRLQDQAQGLGGLQVPFSTLDLLGLRKKIITRNFELTQGRGVEI
ncbi:hypothetical protein NDA11_007335 [Ustilago hordei]|nr:hypothetical protein NDA10_006500 [Ustilago hordei]KAJ1580942.1 hypothetical protein NDA15_001211 [Ustilago hordei]KAJ1582779.1 hypothetical protein NDA12_002694 [Ustilago hordei]KAJ1588840.1 hypothetical protein NDA11_007335 [Ustilago hordei]